jgi:uncharacterized lipoprotein YmbA
MNRAAAPVAALLAVLALSGCVGPARTTHTYREKAVMAAQAGQSDVETALLSVDVGLGGRLPHAYLETVLSQSEDAFTSVQSQFDSIQPPDTATADHLRESLDSLLSSGADGLAQLRILARRGDTEQLKAEAAKLKPTARKLNTFAQVHQ